jgi:tetratricopeptide (TPR) repeat protein
MKSFLLLVLLVLSSMVALPSTDFTSNCRNAYHEIICLRFNEARVLIESEIKANPGNSIPPLLDNYIDFLTVMLGEQRSDLDRMSKLKDTRLQKLVKGDPSSPWYLFSQADIYLQYGFARIKFGEYVSAGMDINRAFRLYEENDRKFPSFIPGKVRLGLLHALVGTVPDKYQWAVNALNFNGTIPQGTAELKNAYAACLAGKQFDFLLPETIFLLSFVSSNLSGDKNAVNAVVKEFSKPEISLLLSQSPLVRYALVNLKIKSGKNDEAIELLSASWKSPGSYPFCYLDYLLGVSKLNRLDKDSYLPLMKFVGEFRGMNYIRSAYERLAWYYLVQGNMEKYGLYMERIKLRGCKSVDNDRQALSDTEKHVIPDPYLLKARLLFDGGYLEKSNSELALFAATKGFLQAPLRLEYTYRTARVYDEWGKTTDAIHWYEQTIKLGDQNPSYYAANAMLHLGLIYENRKLYSMASEYYHSCLNQDFEEYNFSIKQKAKSGLNRIKNL